MKWKISMQGIDTSLLFTREGGYVYEARGGLEEPTGLPGIWGGEIWYNFYAWVGYDRSRIYRNEDRLV